MGRRLHAAIRAGGGTGGSWGWGVVLVLALCLLGDTARAAVDPALPDQLIVVDKRHQDFRLYEQRPEVRVRYHCPCTTGSIPGDKMHEGDKRTPEGIYFIEGRVTDALDFRKYGGIAYRLNYPHPVDRLQGKKGHGIWIHSKGYEIRPLDTQGCVAISLRDMAELKPLLRPGMPVILTAHSSNNIWEARDSITASYLRLQMQRWLRACATGSTTFFHFFQADAYNLCMPESFALFQERMERRFHEHAHRTLYHREIYALEGPHYWVTWADISLLDGVTPLEGICRLYWQQGQDTSYRIVGWEWIPQALGMSDDIQKGLLLPLEKGTDGRKARTQLTLPVPDTAQPPSRTARPPADTSEDLREAEATPPPSVSPEQTPLTNTADTAAQHNGKTEPPGQGKRHPPEAILSDVVIFLDAWRQAWESGDVERYMSFYLAEAHQQQRQGAAAIRQHKSALWNTAAPHKIRFYHVSMRLTAQGVLVKMMQDYTDIRGYRDRGRKTLLLSRVAGKLHILDEQWTALDD